MKPWTTSGSHSCRATRCKCGMASRSCRLSLEEGTQIVRVPPELFGIWTIFTEFSKIFKCHGRCPSTKGLGFKQAPAAMAQCRSTPKVARCGVRVRSKSELLQTSNNPCDGG